MPVDLCAWCAIPDKPDPLCHPDGDPHHRTIIRVTLTPAEREEAAGIGLKRETLRRSRGKGKRTPADRGGSWNERNTAGAIAEYAVAKHYGVTAKWLAEQAYSLEHETIESDVASNLQVRASTLPYAGLILHDYDKDAPYILAIVQDTVALVGWATARLARKPTYWKSTGRGWSSRPAYCVPQSDLFPMSTLEAI